MKRKTIKDVAVLTVMQLFLDSSALLLNVFIARKLGTSATGILSLMGSFLGLAGIVSNGNAFLCTSRLISEELGRKNGNPNKILFHGIKLCMCMSLIVSGVITAFADTISSKFFSGADMSTAVKLMPFALVTGAVSACIKGYFNAVRKTSVTAVGDVLEFAVKATVIILLTFFSASTDEHTVCRIMIESIIAGNIFSMIFFISAYIKLHIRCTGEGSISFRKYASFAFPIMWGGILTSVLGSANDALIPVCLKQYGDSVSEALSLFGIFEAIVMPVLFFPSVVLCSVSGIIVSESARAKSAENTERIKSLTLRIIQMTLIYAVFASAVLMRFGVSLGKILGGGETAGKMIMIISPVVPFIYLEIVLEALIKGMGLQTFSSLNYLAEYVIRISAVLIFVPHIGFSGIAVSYYASNIFGNTMRMIKILRFTGVKLGFFSSVVMPMVYAFLTMGTAELLFRPFGISESIPFMIIFTLLWGAGYMGIFIIFGKISLDFSENKTRVVQNRQIIT